MLNRRKLDLAYERSYLQSVTYAYLQSYITIEVLLYTI